MKILVVSQHYWPEPMYALTDMCEELVRRGHTVDVVTDVPNYPMGYIYDEYKHRQRRRENHNGVNIIRTFTIGRRHNAVFRLLNYYSYSFSSTLYTHGLKTDYDVVFTNETSPVMMTRAATAYSHKHKKKCILYCMDLWPACLKAGGMREDSLIYKFFGRVSKKLYNRADTILITSRMFKDYLMKEHQVPEERIIYFPQYASSQFDDLPQIEKKPGYDFVFAGNIGTAQSLDTVINAAKLLPNMDIRWHFVGDGSELQNLKKLAEGMNNVIFHGRKPLEDMPKYYAMADAMLVLLLNDPLISLTLPGKEQTYMAAGKPILAAGTGEIPMIIEEAKCGWCAKAEDVEEFVEVVRKFINFEDKEKLGRNAREYYEANFDRKQFMDKLEKKLTQEAEKCYEDTND